MTAVHHHLGGNCRVFFDSLFRWNMIVSKQAVRIKELNLSDLKESFMSLTTYPTSSVPVNQTRNSYLNCSCRLRLICCLWPLVLPFIFVFFISRVSRSPLKHWQGNCSFMSSSFPSLNLENHSHFDLHFSAFVFISLWFYHLTLWKACLHSYQYSEHIVYQMLHLSIKTIL